MHLLETACQILQKTRRTFRIFILPLAVFRRWWKMLITHKIVLLFGGKVRENAREMVGNNATPTLRGFSSLGGWKWTYCYRKVVQKSILCWEKSQLKFCANVLLLDQNKYTPNVPLFENCVPILLLWSWGGFKMFVDNRVLLILPACGCTYLLDFDLSRH